MSILKTLFESLQYVLALLQRQARKMLPQQVAALRLRLKSQPEAAFHQSRLLTHRFQGRRGLA